MAKNRTNGECTVFQRKDRPGTWRGQAVWINPVNHERFVKSFDVSAGTELQKRRDALKKAQDWLAKVQSGLLPDADKMTVKVWLKRWLEDYVKPNVRIKSHEKYASCLNNYIIDSTIGNVIITKLQAPDVQTVLNDMLAKGGKKGQGVSTFVVRATRRYLIQAVGKAMEIGLVSRNVIKFTTPPKLVKQEIHPLAEEQADKLLKTAKEGEYIWFGCKQRQKPDLSTKYLVGMTYMAVLLTIETGMRAGEVFGLKWSDIDFTQNKVNIQRSLVASNHGVHFTEPKTKGSRRRIPVTTAVIKKLEQYREEQRRFANELGDKFNNDADLIFPNSSGKPFNTTNFSARYFKRIVKQAGLDSKFRFHDLRHTHATALLGKGVNIKVISERLGHSSIKITLDTYSHLMPDMQATAVIALEGLFIKDIDTKDTD